METTFLENYPNSKPSYKFEKILSIIVIIIVALSLLFGTQIVDVYLLQNISNNGIQIFQMAPIPKNTFFEAIIALLNIVLAIYVFVDLYLLNPIDKVFDNSPAAESFKQLLLGWQILWTNWLLL